MTLNGDAGAGVEDPQSKLTLPYAAALALVVLILVAEGRIRRREALLLEANQAERKAADDAIRVAEEVTAGRGLPSDTRAVLTERGPLCPRGLDHPAGSRAEGEECQACIAWAAEEAEREQPGPPRAKPEQKPTPPRPPLVPPPAGSEGNS